LLLIGSLTWGTVVVSFPCLVHTVPGLGEVRCSLGDRCLTGTWSLGAAMPTLPPSGRRVTVSTVNALGDDAGAADRGVGRDPPDQARLRQLAEEQAALRQVATLVARGELPEVVFAAVVEESGRVLSAGYAHLGRYEPDGALTSVARWGEATANFPVGSRWILGGRNVITLVSETAARPGLTAMPTHPARPAPSARERGVDSAAGTLVIVEGRLWGVVVVGTRSGQQPLPSGTEARLASFTELVATAVANADSRAQLSLPRADHRRRG
jgi:hypothetical protein